VISEILMKHRIVISVGKDADLLPYVEFLRDALGKEFTNNTGTSPKSFVHSDYFSPSSTFNTLREAYVHIRGEKFEQHMTATIFSVFRAKNWWAGAVTGIDLKKPGSYREFAFLLDDEILALQLKLMVST
jgi:hypothetical protein